MNNVFNCSIISINKIDANNGSITVYSNSNELPFSIKRIFYLYDIPNGESRGAHAHKECHQLLIAATGSFEVSLDDGHIKKSIQLNSPNLGLHIPPGIWASEINFSGGAVCLVFASHEYDENDYLRKYEDYLLWREKI